MEALRQGAAVNYPEFPDSCPAVDFAFVINVDEMFVYRICSTNDDVAGQLLRIRHLHCFVDFHFDFIFGRPARQTLWTWARPGKTRMADCCGLAWWLTFPIVA